MNKLTGKQFVYMDFSRGTVLRLREAAFVSFNKSEKGKRWGGESDNNT